MLANMGGFDASEQPVSNATTADLDPLERERLRQIITKYNGDGSLLQLSDDELDGALGLTIDFGGGAIPTVTGLLLIGREESLRKMIPAHEVLFQVLAGTSVRMNDGFRAPLLKVFETLLERFRARNNEQEIDEGMFRVPVPDYDERAFREALVNALAHRDYMLLGAVHVQMTDEGLSISSPGGFIEGVTVENLLYTAPRSRNPRLADALKRVGLAERTGRGVDRIYQGMLRYGRPEPDYSTSTTTTVTVTMQYTRADTAFFRLILNAEQQIGGPMPVDDLLVLSYLREARKLTADVIAAHLHKSETAIRAILTRLIERGLVEAHGTSRGQGRTYTLSAMVYRAAGQQSEYVRQVGFDHIQQEQMVLKYVKAHGHISRREVMELCQLGEDQAYRVLRRLSEEGKLVRIGFTKSAIYILSE